MNNRSTVTQELSTRRFLMSVLYIGIPLVVSTLASVLSDPNENWVAQTNNVFNQVFAKNAWGWAVLVSLALARIQFLRGKLQSGFAQRFVWATVYWALLTQNLFGASFRERVFLASGGSCILGEANTLSQCKAYGPNGWVGGHRISGHCLLLIHASLFLWEEFGQMLYMPIPERNEQKLQSSADYSPVEHYVIYGARTILVLFLWLLTITCMYFHSFPEKLSGIFFGSLFWGTSYFYIFPALSFCP